MKRLYSIAEAATFLGRTPGAVRNMIYKGRLPVVRIDRKFAIDLKDMEKLIEGKKEIQAEGIR